MSQSFSTESFKERLNCLMREAGYTQDVLAKKIHISRTAISNYLNTDRTATAEILIKLSGLFDVSVDWLLGLTNVRERDEVMKRACAETGLTERSYKALQYIRQEEKQSLDTLREGRGIAVDKDSRQFLKYVAESEYTKRTRGINALVSSNVLSDFSLKLVDYLFSYRGEEQKKLQLEAVIEPLKELHNQINDPPNKWNNTVITKYTRSLFAKYIQKVYSALEQAGDDILMGVFMRSCNDFLKPYLNETDRDDIYHEIAGFPLMEYTNDETDKED